MGKFDKLILTILVAKSDNNIRFDDLCNLLHHLGFDERIKGSHHIFRKSGIQAKINLQKDGSLAKSYQVKQVRNALIENYLIGEIDV